MNSNRTKSSTKYYLKLINEILKYQDPVTGLFPASPENDHAWVRDNVYIVSAIWGVSMVCRKLPANEIDPTKTYTLEQNSVNVMRGLLMSMMRQRKKVEKFKVTQNPEDALHAKYSALTGKPVVGDRDWGHLQMDATSLYLLILAQMTASGLHIIFNLDEVAFIQNLIFYIESAYCIPDYGIWERGDKSNHGLPELNASSIGMAKAALEAMNGINLFGDRGGPLSVIHVLPDESQKCQAVLQSLLPRESSSKEIDSGLLSIISFPAFAIDDSNLIELTRHTIISKLKGRYGCKRFLRDGYKTPKEDPNRLYYDPSELRIFERIECEWPLFFCYLILDYGFQGHWDAVQYYSNLLEQVMVPADDGSTMLVPELYAVPLEKVDEEFESPGSQERIAAGRRPFLWAQSLYILGKLLQDGYLNVRELDPLNRHKCTERKPGVVVQVVILAEDNNIREMLQQQDISIQTIAEVAPIEVHPARVLRTLYSYLGRNEKLQLTGRKSQHVGILSTSKLYLVQNKVFAFTPQTLDLEQFYMGNDVALLADNIMDDLFFLSMNWKNTNCRPLYIIIASSNMIDHDRIPLAMITTIKKLKSGYINGTRVTLGNLNDFLNTSCVTNLGFLLCQDGTPNKLNPEIERYLAEHVMKPSGRRTSLLAPPADKRSKTAQRKLSVKGAIKKTRSIISADGGGAGQQHEAKYSSDRGSITRSPSPEDFPIIQEPTDTVKTNRVVDTQYANIEVEELLTMLKESEYLEEQGDILQYLADSKGQNFETGIFEQGKSVTVKDLLKVMYEKTCQQKSWGLVRHTAGMLGKRVEDLAMAVTDLLVRQKQVTIGIPPNKEHIITAPLPENELRQLIHEAYGDDESTAMLTQELLVYSAMFIRTEPQLFLEMLRLRIGLITQVMATELSRTLVCPPDEATEHLLNLSPYEMKNLLYHIMSGKEFAISSVGCGNFSIVSRKSSHVSKKTQIGSLFDINHLEATKELEIDRQGQWLRRRRLDGALNRVPKNFYARVWVILEKCGGLAIEGRLLPHTLTEEMTSGELKFALALECVLNCIPQPEYRQLIVEALMVLTLVTEYCSLNSLGGIITVERLVHSANRIFLEDQVKMKGDAILCCAKFDSDHSCLDLSKGTAVCGGAAYICQLFYDSAPSGSYGTMTYLMRGMASVLHDLPQSHQVNCLVS